jgi:dTDP-glucose 4,6-dehydratase
MFDTIIEGTRRVLELAAERGATRFLFTSSGAVYGRQPTGLTHIPEDYPGAPQSAAVESAYAEGKRAAETLCALHASAAMRPTIARCFAFLGPYLPLNAHFAAGNFIGDALGGGPVRINGNGTPFRSYMYPTDLTVWLWTILLRGIPLRPYNVGSEQAVTVASLASLVAASATPSLAIDMKVQSESELGIRYVPSTARARSELGLEQTISLEQAVSRTLAWHRSGH